VNIELKDHVLEACFIIGKTSHQEEQKKLGGGRIKMEGRKVAEGVNCRIWVVVQKEMISRTIKKRESDQYENQQVQLSSIVTLGGTSQRIDGKLGTTLYKTERENLK